MSSIVEKTQTPPMAAKTSFFFRSSSIEKIKCTAAYPFQVAGTKLSKDAIIELLETNIIKSRICTHRALLNIYIGILKLVSAMYSLLITPNKNSVIITECCDNIKTQTDKVPVKSSFHERIQEKLNKLQKHKNRFDGKKETSSISASVEPMVFNPKPVAIESPVAVTVTVQQKFVIEKNLRNDLKTQTAHLAKERLSFETQFPSSLSQLSQPINKQEKVQKYLFVLCVHFGLVVMYMQILVLAIALNTTKIPYGLGFLLSTLAMIGYILHKVCADKPTTETVKRSPNKCLDKAINNSNDKNNNKDISSVRQSRSTLKRIAPVIDFDSKTLSKVKLL